MAVAPRARPPSRRAGRGSPRCTDLVTTEDVVGLLRNASVPVVLHEAASGPLADLPVPGRGEIVIVVGPEGGISDEELEAFAAVGAEPVRLGHLGAPHAPPPASPPPRPCSPAPAGADAALPDGGQWRDHPVRASGSRMQRPGPDEREWPKNCPAARHPARRPR